jgi:hypothetical protein
MGNTSQLEKDQMADLIRIINAGSSNSPEKAPAMRQAPSMGPGLMSGPEVDAKADMKRILETFYGQGSPSDNLKQRATVDRELREALITEATTNGTKMGSWEIVTQQDDNGLKSFDIVNVHTNEAIATDLSLYDAAFGIVRTLNEGGAINSPKVRDILVTEAEYARMRQNAANFRDRVKQYSKNVLNEGVENKLELAKSRYSDALSRAKMARSRIEKLVKG